MEKLFDKLWNSDLIFTQTDRIFPCCIPILHASFPSPFCFFFYISTMLSSNRKCALSGVSSKLIIMHLKKIINGFMRNQLLELRGMLWKHWLNQQYKLETVLLVIFINFKLIIFPTRTIIIDRKFLSDNG